MSLIQKYTTDEGRRIEVPQNRTPQRITISRSRRSVGEDKEAPSHILQYSERYYAHKQETEPYVPSEISMKLSFVGLAGSAYEY
jgi:hypothetical protein